MALLSPGALSFSFAGLRKKILPAAVALTMSAGAANAQFFDRPASRDQSADPAPSADTSSILRIDRLENQVRGLNGQVEQLQFQVKKLEDQLRKFQMDVDLRFQDGGGKSRPRALPPPRRRSTIPSCRMTKAAPRRPRPSPTPNRPQWLPRPKRPLPSSRRPLSAPTAAAMTRSIPQRSQARRAPRRRSARRSPPASR